MSEGADPTEPACGSRLESGQRLVQAVRRALLWWVGPQGTPWRKARIWAAWALAPVWVEIAINTYWWEVA